MELPRVIRVRQSFAQTKPVDIAATISREFAHLQGSIKRDDHIAVGVGSRGISQLVTIVAAVIEQLKSLGANPFLIPAMGSHGGATAQGQRDVLASYGITESTMGIPIRDSLDVRQVGISDDHIPAYCSSEALDADGILLINRIKPHTDFSGTLGSGIVKMSVVGLGKSLGAKAMHLGAMQFGYERTIRGLAQVLLDKVPILGGIAILENPFHETAKIVVVPKNEIEKAELDLLAEARSLMPSLPFDEIDLLIVDQIGKNISGAGMDPNVINRSIHGYNSLPIRGDRLAPFIRRIFVRGLTHETHGNAIGVGMADATTTRLVESIDKHVTSINALTSLTPQSAKIPLSFETDLEAITKMIATLPLASPRDAKVVRILDTLSIAELEISEPLWFSVQKENKLQAVNELKSMQFDHAGNLT